jgi:translation initiation factor IF-3
MHLKEVKMRPKIDDHDYSFKLQHARDFLAERDKVKFTVTFRGREMAHQEIGRQLVERIVTDLADVATVEQSARSEGRTLTMVVMPKPQQQVQQQPKPAAPRAERPAAASGAES